MATKTNTKINGKDYFRIRRTIDGVQKSFYGKSKGDAERKYKEYLEQISREKYEEQTAHDNATFGERAEEFAVNVLSVSQKYAKGTISAYLSAYRLHIKDSDLSKMKLKDVRASDIQKFYNELDVSMHKIKEIHKFMSAFYKWLVLNNYSVNVLVAVEIPRKEDTTRHDDIIVWEDDEIRKILDALNALESRQNRHRQHFMLYMLLYTGMRISEVLGLKYSDIYDGIIHVDRQYYLEEIKPPKWNSRRQIPMHHVLIEELEAHRAWHEDEMKRNGYSTDFVFTTSTGELYYQASVRKALKRFYKKYDITYKHIHAYRATFCTNLCRCGVSLEVASKLMGHKSMEVTAAHYALVKTDSLQDAINAFDYKI
jgi:site-specific recombinase XerD